MDKWFPFILASILLPTAGWVVKWLIKDWFEKSKKIEEFKELANKALLDGLSVQLKQVVNKLDDFQHTIENNTKAVSAVGEKIRKNVEDNRNVSRNVRSQMHQMVIDTMREEMPKLIKEFANAARAN